MKESASLRLFEKALALCLMLDALSGLQAYDASSARWMSPTLAILQNAQGVLLTPAWQMILVLVELLFVFLIYIGRFQRLSALALLGIYYFQMQNPLISFFGVHIYFKIFLFLLLLLPIQRGDQLSEEAIRFNRFSVLMLRLTMASSYLIGAISKSFGQDWWNGAAIWKALLIQDPAWRWFPIQQMPVTLLMIFGWCVLLIESSAILASFSRRFRRFWLSAILVMHLASGLCLDISLFATSMILLNFALFWDGQWPTILKRKAAVLGQTSPQRS